MFTQHDDGYRLRTDLTLEDESSFFTKTYEAKKYDGGRHTPGLRQKNETEEVWGSTWVDEKGWQFRYRSSHI